MHYGQGSLLLHIIMCVYNTTAECGEVGTVEQVYRDNQEQTLVVGVGPSIYFVMNRAPESSPPAAVPRCGHAAGPSGTSEARDATGRGAATASASLTRTRISPGDDGHRPRSGPCSGRTARGCPLRPPPPPALSLLAGSADGKVRRGSPALSCARGARPGDPEARARRADGAGTRGLRASRCAGGRAGPGAAPAGKTAARTAGGGPEAAGRGERAGRQPRAGRGRHAAGGAGRGRAQRAGGGARRIGGGPSEPVTAGRPASAAPPAGQRAQPSPGRTTGRGAGTPAPPQLLPGAPGAESRLCHLRRPGTADPSPAGRATAERRARSPARGTWPSSRASGLQVGGAQMPPCPAALATRWACGRLPPASPRPQPASRRGEKAGGPLPWKGRGEVCARRRRAEPLGSGPAAKHADASRCHGRWEGWLSPARPLWGRGWGGVRPLSLFLWQ